MKKSVCVAAALLLLSSSAVPLTAAAQTVVAADSVAGQPTIRRDDKGFAACGVRLIVHVAQKRQAEIYDFSINLGGDMLKGLLKAGKYFVPAEGQRAWDFNKRKVVQPAPISYWFSRQSEGASLRPEKYSPAEDAGFVLGIADFERTAQTILAITEGERMQFALKYKGDRFERVISFKPDLEKNDREAILDCVIGMGKRIEGELQQPEPNE